MCQKAPANATESHIEWSPFVVVLNSPRTIAQSEKWLSYGCTSCRYRHADLLRDKISSHVCPVRYILWFYWRRKASSAWKIPKAWCFMCLDCLFKYFTSESRSKRAFGAVPTSRIFCPRGVKHNSSADNKAGLGFLQTNQSWRHQMATVPIVRMIALLMDTRT